MNIDPYKILKIKKDAIKEQIQKAYRILAKKHHPDRGGDPEKFKEVQFAYDLLMDDNKRAHYDATGECGGSVDNSHCELLNLIFASFQRVVSEALKPERLLFNPKTTNLVEAIRIDLKAPIPSLKIDIARAEQGIKDLMAITARFVKPEEGNVFHTMLRRELDGMKRGVEMLNQRVKEIEEAVKFLDGYEYRTDKEQPYSRYANLPGRIYGIPFVEVDKEDR